MYQTKTYSIIIGTCLFIGLVVTFYLMFDAAAKLDKLQNQLIVESIIQDTRSKIIKEAIDNYAGKWTINPQTGEKSWQWTGTAPTK